METCPDIAQNTAIVVKPRPKRESIFFKVESAKKYEVACMAIIVKLER